MRTREMIRFNVSNVRKKWATLKWSFYVSFCPPSAHPSNHNKLFLTLSLSNVRPGANRKHLIGLTPLRESLSHLSSGSSRSSLFVITVSKTFIMVKENMHVINECGSYNINVKHNVRGIIVSLHILMKLLKLN